jgi:lysophospholipase L1-like esterase
MKVIFIFMWFAFTLAKNIILIGDSRTYLMAIYLFGFPLTPDSSIKSKTLVTYKGHRISVTAKGGARVYDFVSGDLYNSMHDQLRSAPPGTLVFLWLGVNNIRNYVDTRNLYVGLAEIYRHVKFYAFSVAGVNETRLKNIHEAKNNQVLMFNLQLSNLIRDNKANTPHLVFKSIMKDPVTFKSGQNIMKYLYDGIHFDAAGSKIIFNLMTEGL